jgi:multidrug efflux pump subunit AcrA (membrane-fusion protein)
MMFLIQATKKQKGANIEMKPKTKSKKKAIVIIAIVLVLAAAAAIILPNFVNASNSRKAAQSTAQTKTVTVGTQDIRKEITGTGQIVTGDQETLTPDTDKEVDEVKVSEGQSVKKGAVLLTYTDDTTLTAPFNGIMGAISVSDSSSASSTASSSSSVKDSGNTANSVSTANNASAAKSDSLIIMSTDTLHIQLTVDETDLSSLKSGQAAEITVNALPDVPYTGKVTAISETGTYSNGSSTFVVTITLDKTTNVKIGMSADVIIVVNSVKDAVAVPIEAVTGSGDNAKVSLVASDGTVSSVSVQLGLANDAFVQISSGLSVGDTIQYTVKTSSTTTMGGMQGFSGTRTAGGTMQGFGGSTRGNETGGAQPGANNKQG